ncbi:hypothetical protein J3R82DRAFT_1460 [Butyriboletus roseoflavus]|nr:hypothetical protein J3R82DRAFT_1460 [Butyriboletus roseoflavus]
MDSPKLRELTRIQLQSLAKREVVRAVGKTEDIIRRLMRKHPRGVPVPEGPDNHPSASSAPPKRNVLKKSRKGTLSPSPIPETSGACTDPKGKGKLVPEVASSSSLSSTEALEQLLYVEDEPVAGPSNTNLGSISLPHLEATEAEALPDHRTAQLVPLPEILSPVPPSEHPSREAQHEDENTRSAAPPPEVLNPDLQADEGEELDDVYDGDVYPKGAPTRYMVVDTLRQFTTLVNTIPAMKTRIAESRCILQRTESLLEKATPDARELTVTREYLETFLLAKMKKKRELWDGTGKMEKKARKFRMEWLRAERKAENVKRWKEANELNRQHGLKPEPFSAFASESDEEVIESLQSTPASSSSGSSKRSREESVDAGSGGDVDADDESQRKRARS